MVQKITPEVEKYIYTNRALSGGVLKDRIATKFKIVVTKRSVELYLARARATASEDNAAKIEAVREKILESGDLRAEKYLKYLDENVEALNELLKGAKGKIKIESTKDYVAASQALLKSLSTVLDFVKPSEKPTITNINIDLSKFNEEELEQYGRLAAKLAGIQEGEGKTTPT
jgi:hypothetical protein